MTECPLMRGIHLWEVSVSVVSTDCKMTVHVQQLTFSRGEMMSRRTKRSDDNTCGGISTAGARPRKLHCQESCKSHTYIHKQINEKLFLMLQEEKCSLALKNQKDCAQHLVASGLNLITTE